MIVQKILPSIHLLEIFMPVVNDEQFFVDEIVARIPDIPFYKGMETGVLFDAECRRKVRDIVEREEYQLTVWLSPSINDHGYNLSSLDRGLRKQSVQRALDVMQLAFEMGATHLGIPCGPHPGAQQEGEAIEALVDSYRAMLEAIKEYPQMDFTFEPLDRSAHKKQLLGPMQEVVDVFKVLRKDYDNIFIHWDSAHEVLNGNDLFESLETARPYLAQIHLSNCVPTPSHPYYGDWHMSVGQAPEFRNWGFLTAEIGSDLVKKVASFDPSAGVKNTFCAVEVRTAQGNDLWATEKLVREFLQRVFDLAGMEWDR
jgi:sugar phosphate isomerase/epimerase